MQFKLLVAGAMLAVALTLCASFIVAYWRLSCEVNVRWNRMNVELFVTPNDPAVETAVRTVTYGKINPAAGEELLAGVKLLYDWVSANIRPSYDGPYPRLPSNPAGRLELIGEVWQFPNETLAFRSGDCEDAALLLLSMVRFYAPQLRAACVVVEGANGGHVAVLVSDGNKVAFLDPGLYYFTRDKSGFFTLEDLAAELPRWLDVVERKVGSGARPTVLFSDMATARFETINEFVAHFHLRFKD